MEENWVSSSFNLGHLLLVFGASFPANLKTWVPFKIRNIFYAYIQYVDRRKEGRKGRKASKQEH